MNHIPKSTHTSFVSQKKIVFLSLTKSYWCWFFFFFFFSSSFLLSVCCAFLDSVVSIRRVVLIVLVERSQEKGSQTPKKRRQKSHNRITTRFLEFIISIQKCLSLSLSKKKRSTTRQKVYIQYTNERTQRTKREKERERDWEKKIDSNKENWFLLLIFIFLRWMMNSSSEPSQPRQIISATDRRNGGDMRVSTSSSPSSSSSPNDSRKRGRDTQTQSSSNTITTITTSKTIGITQYYLKIKYNERNEPITETERENFNFENG